MTPKGLTNKKAQEYLEKYGENTLRNDKKIRPLKIFAGQFKDFMVVILLISTVISTIMGETFEALTIICIVLLNAVLGFIQEYKTERTLKALKNFSPPVAKVIRDGEMVEIESRLIVPEDVVFIKAGDKIPADCKIISSADFSCDESILTGESIPVEKKESDEIYMGTNAIRGKATATVVFTGQSTKMGEIASMLGEIEEEPTPLQQKLSQLGKIISVMCIVICAVVMVVGIIRGENVLSMLITGVSLAVAAVPEGLPAIVTICLALAVGRILKRNALIKHLHAVETLGCTNVICSDKTGTLTENKMTVSDIFTANQSDFELGLLNKIAILCNSAEVGEKIIGDPTETALIEMAKPNFDVIGMRNSHKIIGEIPFDSSRKLMTVAVKEETGTYTYTKGAFDVLLDRCAYFLNGKTAEELTVSKKNSFLTEASKYASDGKRVLAFAYNKTANFSQNTCENKMVFVGMCALIDPPRKEAFSAVKKCRRAGIKPVMITGDHKDTAKSIAKSLDIYRDGDQILTGAQLDTLTDSQLNSVVGRVSVFARVTPKHKLRIVKAFKNGGNIVAMTGDGVNDAPAVKEADIGVAMGKNGTDVTKEAADIILLDDNFATIVSAVEEGRTIYMNIRKFIRYLLSCNIGEVVTMFLGMIMGLPVVLSPIQILLINLVTDSLPALALGVEKGESDTMTTTPRSKNSSVFSNGLAGKIITRGIFIGLTTLAVFVGFYNKTSNLTLSRTAALVTLVATQLVNVFECKSETKPIYKIKIFSNMKLVFSVFASALTVALTLYLKPLQEIFQTTPLSLSQLATIILASLTVPILTGLFTKTKKAERE